MRGKTLAMVTAAVFIWLPLHAQTGTAALTEAQLNGKKMFQQRCSICHTPPQPGGRTYGPLMSMETVTGKEAGVRALIMMGTPRMPGFQYTLEPQEVDNIIAYLKTVKKVDPPKVEAPVQQQVD